ncbi:MAG: hypothetical protein AAFP10_05975 [Pseudomonadota bacterium]
MSDQIKTGYYSSASEVICEALRNQIKFSENIQLNERITINSQQVKDRSFIIADKACFNKARAYVKKIYI